MRSITLATTILWGLSAGYAVAQDCKAIENDIERLACYDAQASQETLSMRDPVEILAEYRDVAVYYGSNGGGTFEVFDVTYDNVSPCMVKFDRTSFSGYNSYYRAYEVRNTLLNVDFSQVERFSRTSGHRVWLLGVVMERDSSVGVQSLTGEIGLGEPWPDDIDGGIVNFFKDLITEAGYGTLVDPGIRLTVEPLKQEREVGVFIVADEYSVDFDKAYDLLEELWQSCRT